MKPETQEWVEKAEGDLKVARREAQTVDPVYEAVCFHAQQGVEKYMKAILEEHNIVFPKIHDLIALMSLRQGMFTELNILKPRLARLSVFGIAARYLGVRADQKAATGALQTTGEVRTVM